jgi:hypothetical protein
MNKHLDTKVGSDYLGVLIFGPSRGSFRRYTTRAYLDLARTLRTVEKSSRDLRVERCKDILLSRLELLKRDASWSMSQDSFDTWHEVTCSALRTEFGASEMHYGQAQKWVNMTLKYVFTMGAVGIEDIEMIERAYAWAHMPIDRIIITQIKAFGFPASSLPTGPWSKIGKDEYLKLQKDLQGYFEGECLMDTEFRLWKGLEPAKKS